jgi:hypothetical protein
MVKTCKKKIMQGMLFHRLTLLVMAILAIPCIAKAQYIYSDSLQKGAVTIVQDERIEWLGRKMAEYNESLANKLKMEKGYRLMLLSTSNRNEALQLRAQLLKAFPEHKVYMVFQTPYIKIKFGNFTEKEEAAKMRKQLLADKYVTGNIYLVPEMVETRQNKAVPGEE